MAYDFIPEHKSEGIYYVGWSERRETGRWQKAWYRPLRRCWWVFLLISDRIKRFGPYLTLGQALRRADRNR